jgi:hypothetical protein
VCIRMRAPLRALFEDTCTKIAPRLSTKGASSDDPPMKSGKLTQSVTGRRDPNTWVVGVSNGYLDSSRHSFSRAALAPRPERYSTLAVKMPFGDQRPAITPLRFAKILPARLYVKHADSKYPCGRLLRLHSSAAEVTQHSLGISAETQNIGKAASDPCVSLTTLALPSVNNSARESTVFEATRLTRRSRDDSAD